MNDEEKTKEQLIDELVQIRKHMAELEQLRPPVLGNPNCIPIKRENDLESVHSMEDLLNSPRTEMALRESEEQFKASFETAAHRELRLKAISNAAQDAIIALDNQGAITFWNPAAERIFGYSAPEAFGKNAHALLAPQRYHNEGSSAFEDFKKTGLGQAVGRTLELMALRKNGEEFPIELSLSTFQMHDCWHAVGIVRDISERKLAATRIERSELKFSKIFWASPAAISLSSFESGCFVDVNESFQKLSGYTREEIIGRSSLELGLWNSDVRSHFFELLREEGIVRDLEFEFCTKSGTMLTASISAETIEIEGELCILVIANNTTERKRAETALKQSEQKFRAIFDQTFQFVAVLTVDGKVMAINDNALQFLGTQASQVEGKPFWQVDWRKHSPEQQELIETVVRKAALGEIARYEAMVPSAKGDIHSFDCSAKPLIDETGRVAFLIVEARDITERKHVEDELKESRQQLSDIIDFLPDATFVIDMEGKVIAWNRAIEALTGIQAPIILGKGDYEYALPFYGDRKPLLIDLVLRPQRDIELQFAPIERKDGMLSREAHAPGLQKNGSYLFETASALYDSRGNLVGAIESLRDITERRLMEEAIARAEEKYRNIFENSITGIWQMSVEGRFLSVNKALAELHGYASPEEFLNDQKSAMELLVNPDNFSLVRSQLEEHGVLKGFEVELYRKDKSIAWASLNVSAVRDKDGKIAYLEGTALDITDSKHLRAQLEQAQKMESVGRLAGGVAHDFNNILGVINGRTELALRKDISPEVRKDLEEILRAGRRSADLTRKLLAFARKQTVIPRVLDLNETISGMLKMLRRLIGEDIDLSWMPGLDLWKVKIDPSQVDQIMINLAVNSRDAISGEGTITIKTENIVMDGFGGTAASGLVPGEFVLMTIRDTGGGINKDICEKVFDPFFTTKELGKGTGLGLSTVYGIVKQNNGFIYVESEPKVGTAFKIYLPRFMAEGEYLIHPERVFRRPSGTETILLVEDDEAILEVCEMMLKSLGYTVLVSNSPQYAAQLFSAHRGEIDLLITDVVMPGMNGRELMERLRDLRPGLKCLFMSGYTAEVIVHKGVLEKGVNFIQKPFTVGDFAVKVRAALKRRCP